MKTTKEMIEVMEWFSKGGEVEWVAVGCNDWERVIKPFWNWNNFDYRIKEFQYPMWFKDKQSIPKPIEEGTRNRGGVNPSPSSSRPNFTPPAMKPKNTEIKEPKGKVRIEKWLVRSNEGEYRVVEASNIHMIENIVTIKLLDTYVIEI